MNKNNAQLNCPEPVSLPVNILSAKNGDDYRKTAELLAEGKSVLIKDQFPTGLKILSELKKNCV